MSFKYRKKPVVIEAAHYIGDGNFENHNVPSWAFDALEQGVLVEHGGELKVVTLEGELTVSPGDWLIRGVQGELYPCKPDIFAATYDVVGEP